MSIGSPFTIHNGLRSPTVNGPIYADVPFLVNGGEVGASGPALGRRSYFVDTVNGVDSGDGTSDAPYSTVAFALTKVVSGDAVYIKGDVREEVVAPLGVYGVKLIGNVLGQTRHDNGCRWREPASGATTAGALLTLIEQGWEVHNILFVPKSDATALRIRRAEDATYPDGSHARIVGCKFIGAATATTKGIEDVGGSHHNLIVGCEFMTLANAIQGTSTAIANPLRWQILDNWFLDCTTHIDLSASSCLIRGNVFSEATTNLDLSGGAGANYVLDNYFTNTEADITISDGYTGGSGDMWRNFSTTTAAMTRSSASTTSWWSSCPSP